MKYAGKETCDKIVHGRRSRKDHSSTLLQKGNVKGNSFRKLLLKEAAAA